MKYTARKPFRYGNKIYMAGEGVPVSGDDVKMLQGQGKLGAPIMEKPEAKKAETATMEPIETAMKPKAEPSHSKIEVTEEKEKKKPNSMQKPSGKKWKKKEAGD
jgi:hypothetical protein